MISTDIFEFRHIEPRKCSRKVRAGEHETKVTIIEIMVMVKYMLHGTHGSATSMDGIFIHGSKVPMSNMQHIYDFGSLV